MTSELRGPSCFSRLLAISLKSFAHMKLVWMNWSRTLTMTPWTSGANIAPTPLISMICLAIAIALGDACGAWAAAGLARPSAASAMITAKACRSECPANIDALPLFRERSGPLDQMDPVGAGDNSSPGQPDEQAVFYDPRHRGKPGRKPWRI